MTPCPQLACHHDQYAPSSANQWHASASTCCDVTRYQTTLRLRKWDPLWQVTGSGAVSGSAQSGPQHLAQGPWGVWWWALGAWWCCHLLGRAGRSRQHSRRLLVGFRGRGRRHMLGRGTAGVRDGEGAVRPARRGTLRKDWQANLGPVQAGVRSHAGPVQLAAGPRQAPAAACVLGDQVQQLPACRATRLLSTSY
jgi:hypothetical protein